MPLRWQGCSGIRFLAPVAFATRASPLLSQGLSFATILVFCGIVSAGSTGDPRSFALECPAAYRLRALKFQTRYRCLFFAYVRPRHQGFRSVASAEPQRKISISALAFAESAQDLAPASPRCHRLPQHLSGPSSRPWASQLRSAHGELRRAHRAPMGKRRLGRARSKRSAVLKTKQNKRRAVLK